METSTPSPPCGGTSPASGENAGCYAHPNGKHERSKCPPCPLCPPREIKICEKATRDTWRLLPLSS